MASRSFRVFKRIVEGGSIFKRFFKIAQDNSQSRTDLACPGTAERGFERKRVEIGRVAAPIAGFRAAATADGRGRPIAWCRPQLRPNHGHGSQSAQGHGLAR